MPSHTDVESSRFFNSNWQAYQDSVRKNLLFHREMFECLDTYLSAHYQEQPFSLVDVGCGDSSSIVQVLKNKPIQHYIGIDAAPEVLKIAANNVSLLHCESTFICDEMMKALAQVNESVDIIFSSFAMHHLSTKQKVNFMHACQQKLKEKGVLLMIDGVLDVDQTREQWLKELEARFIEIHPEFSKKQLKERMQHPHENDFPESISWFEKTANSQGWSRFLILENKNILAFLAFVK